MSSVSLSGVFTATLHVVLGDWTAGTERPVYVVLQFKRAATEGDTGTPIYEQSVTSTQGEAEHARTSRAGSRPYPLK